MRTTTSTANRAAHAAPNRMMSWRRGSPAAGPPVGGSPPDGGGANGAPANDGPAGGVVRITEVGCSLGTAEPRSMTSVGLGSGSGSGSGARCAPTCSTVGRSGTTVVGCSLPGGSAGALGSGCAGVAGDRCSVHADPSQYRWPPVPSGSRYQPAGVGGEVIAGG